MGERGLVKVQVQSHTRLLCRIFVISQEDEQLFNRAMNFNVGYVEAMKMAKFNCLGIHEI